MDFAHERIVARLPVVYGLAVSEAHDAVFRGVIAKYIVVNAALT